MRGSKHHFFIVLYSCSKDVTQRDADIADTEDTKQNTN